MTMGRKKSRIRRTPTRPTPPHRRTVPFGTMLYSVAAVFVIGAFFSNVGIGILGLPVSQGAIIERLGREGVDVGMVGEVSVPFFSVRGAMLNVAGEGVQVYEYGARAAVRKDIDAVSLRADSAGGFALTWERPPHVYRFRNHVILYPGSHPDVLAALTRAFGTQVAGE
jgi:hypothetical protein